MAKRDRRFHSGTGWLERDEDFIEDGLARERYQDEDGSKRDRRFHRGRVGIEDFIEDGLVRER